MIPAWIRALPVPTPFPVGPVNCWLIAREPVTLIDAGPHTPEAFAALEAAAAEAGVELARIERLLLTHGHHDHFGAGDELRRRIPALRVMASDRDGHYLRKGLDLPLLHAHLERSGLPTEIRLDIERAIRWTDSFATPLHGIDSLSGGETLAGDGYRVEVLATPGHTPGSLSYRIVGDDGTDLLATGDTVLARITPNAVIDRDPEDRAKIYPSLSHFLASLDRIGALGVRGLLTGHGATIADIGARLERERHLRGLRLEQVREALAGGPQTVWQISERMFPGIAELHHFLAFSEIVGNLVLLAERGQVEVEEGRERDVWRVRG